jgi:hypothetical protein
VEWSGKSLCVIAGGRRRWARLAVAGELREGSLLRP